MKSKFEHRSQIWSNFLKYLVVIMGGIDTNLQTSAFIFYRNCQAVNMVVIIRYQVILVMAKERDETANLKYCGITKRHFVNIIQRLVLAYPTYCCFWVYNHCIWSKINNSEVSLIFKFSFSKIEPLTEEFEKTVNQTQCHLN